jgi:hypothetical protein
MLLKSPHQSVLSEFVRRYSLINGAGSDGRRNTIQCVDSTVLPQLDPFVSL